MREIRKCKKGMDKNTHTSPEPSETLVGVVERVTFHNTDTGFCVLKLKVKGKKDLVTLTGLVPSIVAGEYIHANGTWHRNTSYGLQFKALTFQISSPDTKEGLEKYLGSGLIKGIGPTYAKKLVQVFGKDIINIIENNPHRLREIEGIGQQRYEMILQGWKEQQAVRNIMIFLHEAGVSTARALHIFRALGHDALALIQENPYRLTIEVRGIGFKIADTIAQVLKINPLSILRASAGIHHLLKQSLDQGHCAFPLEELLQNTQQLLDIPRTLIEEALHLELTSNHCIQETIIVENTEGEKVELPLIYLKRIFLAEKNSALLLKKRLTKRPPWSINNMEETIVDIEKKLAMHLSPSQREALPQILSNTVTIITGGPGVGKTTLLKTVLTLLKHQSLDILIAAPTGRAVKRLCETTGMPGKTLHRLLEVDPQTGSFRRGQDIPLECDVLIIDEMSMVDLPLFFGVLKALPEKAALILVGDIDQLPSIGPGKVLEDLIYSGVIPVIRLKEIFRQVGNSQIIINSHRLREGLMPSPAPEQSDFYFISSAATEESIKKILHLITKRIPERFHFNPVTDIQLLCPMVKGKVGTYYFNSLLRPLLNPIEEAGITYQAWEYKKNDKVMQIENDYDKEIYNGDMGFIEQINQENLTLTVNFEGRMIEYERYELESLIPAYSITVHKSQGSEYPVVILPILKEHHFFLTKRLIYTAVTRGKQLVIVIGKAEILQQVLEHSKEVKRWTRLQEWLQLP